MKWRASVDRTLASLGLTHAQYSLLASLSGLSRTGTQPSQRELADYTGLEPIYVSKLARTLEKAGLVERPVHPDDPRAVRLKLTQRGQEVVAEAIGRVHALFAEHMAPIGGPDAPRARELRQSLVALLGETPLTIDESERTMTTPRTINGRTINVAAAATRSVLETLLDKEGLDFDAWIALQYVTEPTTREAVRGSITVPGAPGGPAIEAALDRLAAAGLLRESGGQVERTAEGTELFGRITAVTAQIGDQLFDGIDPRDLAAAERVLERVTERATAVRGGL
ncbi:hypothetical protein GCM10017788_74720 [Amycolatopsis acidiphila]|uniref:MarR family transcriptional regulator n=2 Tax=Amycolatopsis acidiphila TaxID=715473 RepID=A0A557ZNS9_9PSEU|nr:MarR family transcriptional regulator [Amycolatopsis acidiphila]GHG95895.1 hypothetical protein GCM10017788_74720 [Amycolatopsis acidiphila]